MMWLLKSTSDQNSIMINNKPNDNLESHLIFSGTQEKLLVLLGSYISKFFFKKKKLLKLYTNCIKNRILIKKEKYYGYL